MPPGRTGARNYRHRSFEGSSDSDSSPEPSTMKVAPKLGMTSKRSRSRSPIRRMLSPPSNKRSRPHSLSRSPHRSRSLMKRGPPHPSSMAPSSQKRSHSPHHSLPPPPSSRRRMSQRSHGPPPDMDRPRHSGSRRPHESERRHHSQSPPGHRSSRDMPPMQHRNPPVRGREPPTDGFKYLGYLPRHSSLLRDHPPVSMSSHDGRGMKQSGPSRERPPYPEQEYRSREMDEMPPYRQDKNNWYRRNSPVNIGPNHGYTSSNMYRGNRENRENSHGYSDGRNKYPSGPTLDERFRSFGESSRVAEPRVQFTKNDLEKITIDVRNVRDSSPTIRHIVNPNEVKLVRRVTEGTRPIFDREEIKHPPKDMREDAYYESRIVSSCRPEPITKTYSTLSMPSRSSKGNYDGPRNKSSNLSSHDGPNYSQNERWKGYPMKKDLHRSDGEPRRYERGRSIDDYLGNQDHHMNSQSERNMPPQRPPSNRYYDDKEQYMNNRNKMDFRENNSNFQRPMPHDPSDLRYSLSVRRKDGSLLDARQRLMEKRSSRHSSVKPPNFRNDSRSRPPEKNLDSLSGRNRGSMKEPNSESAMYDRDRIRSRERDHERYRSRSPKDRKLPDFSQRPERFKYQPWMDKPEIIPKSPSYFEVYSHFEHDDRGEPNFSRGRFGSMRGRGLRSRGRRPGGRGSLNLSSLRGRKPLYRGSASTLRRTTFGGRRSSKPFYLRKSSR